MSDKATAILVRTVVFAICTLALVKCLDMGHTGFAVFFAVMAFLAWVD